MATAMPGSAVYPRDHYSSWICVVGYLKICDSLFLCFKKQLFVCFLYLLLGTVQTPNWIIIVIVHSLTSESEHLSKFLFCCLCEMTSIHESWSRLALICITISLLYLLSVDRTLPFFKSAVPFSLLLDCDLPQEGTWFLSPMTVMSGQIHRMLASELRTSWAPGP